MGSSIKINSISIDLAGAANEIDMVKCDHFSIRGYVAETREKDHNKCWPFPEESVILVDQESYSLPSLSVPKFRWWRCMSCTRDINTDETNDCGLHPNSRSISGKKLDGNSSIILTQSKLNSLAIIDQEKERRTGDITVNAVEANGDVNCKRSHKDDRRATATFRNKVKKLASQGQGKKKRAKVKDISTWKDKHNVGGQAVTTFRSSDIAGVRRKTRKVRRLSELLDQPETKASGGGGASDNIRREESSSSLKKRGRKRKVLPESNYVSRKLITVGATTSDQDYSTSTDSGFERDVIKGRQKNRRFQVVDEFVPSVLPCETSQKNDADLSKSALSVPCPLSAQRTEKKLSLSSKKKKTQAYLLNDRLAAEGYFRKPIPQVNDSRPVISLHMPENDHVRRLREVEANRLGEFSSSSKPNAGGWLRPGVDAVVDFGGNNNNNTDRLSFQNFNLRNTSSSSTEFADRSSVFQKDASGADDRKGKTVMFQEHHGETTKRQSNDRKENAPEDQNDDIPMEIVELLAKNQYERCLPDKEEDVTNNKQPSQETTHKSKNTLLIDLNETYDNGASLEDNNTSRPPKPFERREEQQHIKSLDFFPITQPYVPSPFGMFPPPQDNRASSNIRFSGQTCQWLGNVPAMDTQPPYRVLRPCNTCQSVPSHQYREAATQPPMWATTSMRPPQCHHRTPVSFNMDPSTKLGMLSQAPSNEINTWNLNFVAAAAASNGKQKCGSSTSEFSFGCKHGNNNGRSVDAFSSESSIPALHLLSLMDPRVGTK
ncbi:Protein EMBRYONIC FLOWER 1 [Hirschfeldia incana]|nr:Protein EMBRYONIC FLOWER 1 [Hirschfeldia incana]